MPTDNHKAPKGVKVATIETPAHGAAITVYTCKAHHVIKVATMKVPSIKDFVPERKEKCPANDSVQAQQSKTTQDKMVSQFESFSGFSGDTAECGGVTIPAKTVQSQPVDKQKILVNF